MWLAERTSAFGGEGETAVCTYYRLPCRAKNVSTSKRSWRYADSCRKCASRGGIMRTKVRVRLVDVSVAVFFAMGLANFPDAWAVNVTTYHYDTLRTGWNPNETVLTPANVHSGSFGFLAAVKVPANQLVGHPLIVEG